MKVNRIAPRLTGLAVIFVTTIGLVACEPAPPEADSDGIAETTLPLFGGYRNEDDPCQRIGESSLTVNFLDHTADLVGCPENSAEAEGFAAMTGAAQVAVLEGYVLFSVPRG